MKKIIFLITIVFVLANALSCNNDFLDLQPTDQYADEAVWEKDPQLVQAFVANIYRGLGQNGIRVMLGAWWMNLCSPGIPKMLRQA